MNLKITSQINTSTGKPVTGAHCNISVNTDYLLSGIVTVEPEFWVDTEAKTKKYDRIIPVLLNDDELIIRRIGSFTIAVAPEGRATYNAVDAYNDSKEYLETTYGWTIIIE